MTVQNLVDKLNLEIITNAPDMNISIDGCYACDLLSLAMANVEKANIWITVQTNMNILGIASLAEASCVLIAHDMNIPRNVIDKAIEEQICILRSDRAVYDLCVEIGKLI